MNNSEINVASLPSAILMGDDHAAAISAAHAEYAALRDKIDAAMKEAAQKFDEEGLAIELKLKALWEAAMASVGKTPNDNLALYAQPGENAYVADYRELQMHIAQVELANSVANVAEQLGKATSAEPEMPGGVADTARVEQIHSPD